MSRNEANHLNKDKKEESPEKLRRDFIKKFGKYAISTPAITFTLMSSYSSKAIASGPDDGAP